MRRIALRGSAAVLATFALALVAFSARGEETDRQKLVDDAVSANTELSSQAIAALRAEGRAGFELFYEAHRSEIEKHIADAKTRDTDPAWQRLLTALDGIAGQRDCYASQLFWYTDLEKAKAESRATGKPILSLRLMGNLTDEFSCANSRFFRTTLYANKEVSAALRDQFILHWQSVRPVPKVTIDFGDGRKLERTLTGNSIHYVLDSDGEVIDALPGLYGPKAFLRNLEQARAVVGDLKNIRGQHREAYLRTYHEASAKLLARLWEHDLQQLGAVANQVQGGNEKPYTTAVAVAAANEPRAAAANRASMTKALVETPILAGALPDIQLLASTTDDAAWSKIAELHQADAELDAASMAFIRAKNPNAGRAGALSASKRAVEDPMLRLVRTFQNTIAIDTVRNDYTFRRQIHEWFASKQMPLAMNVDDLNERVYAQLFLTPRNDPWLGLVPGDVYTALENNGVAQN
jgi:hypothetical protein